MIFKSFDEIIERIKNPVNTEIINRGVEIKRTHEPHFNGFGLENLICKYESLDNNDSLLLKKRLAKPITVPIFEKSIKPCDRVFSAKGGLKYFDIQGDEAKKTFTKLINSTLIFGYNIHEYLRNVWSRKIWFDPLGLSIFEIDENSELILKYISVYDNITPRSICVNIHDIDFTSIDKVEYVIFNYGESANNFKQYRVIDDAIDVIIEYNNYNDTYAIIDEKKNYFGKVPIVINSSLEDKRIDNAKTSYCEDAIILGDIYFDDWLNYRIYKTKMGIPRFWEFKTVCEDCNGKGNIEVIIGKNLEITTCKTCEGKGFNSKRTMSDIYRVDILERDVQSYIPPAGAVTLPVDVQNQMFDELEKIESKINETIWGVGTIVESDRKDVTAYEIAIKNEKENSKLKLISKNKSIVEKFLYDTIGEYYLKGSYKGSIVNADTIFINNSPTELLQVYYDAKTKKAPSYQLTNLYLQYLEAEYGANQLLLEKNIKYFYLNPLPHFSLDEVVTMEISEIDFEIKKNFEYFIYELEKKYNVNETQLDILRKYMIDLAVNYMKINEKYDTIEDKSENKNNKDNDTEEDISKE